MAGTVMTYNAIAEYDKDSKGKGIQGNIPRGIYNRALSNLVNGLINSPEIKAANNPGFTARMQKWAMLDDAKKAVLIEELSYDEVVCAIGMEAEKVGSSYILNQLVQKKMLYENGVPAEEVVEDKSE